MAPGARRAARRAAPTAYKRHPGQHSSGLTACPTCAGIREPTSPTEQVRASVGSSRIILRAADLLGCDCRARRAQVGHHVGEPATCGF
jgi:hypothetical protein